MTTLLDEATLGQRLVNYLVTNIGCSPAGIGLEATLKTSRSRRCSNYLTNQFHL
jgi:hypothetical protein